MKKTLITIIAAAAMIMGMASCSLLTKDALKNNGKSWKNERISLKASEMGRAGTVTLINTDDYKITGTYFMWTNEKGIVRDDLPIPTKDSDGNYSCQIPASAVTKEDLNGNATSEVFVLYTVISGKDKNHEDLTKYDVRGRFAVYTDGETKVFVEKYPEVIDPVGTVTFTNDEPTSKSIYTNGNYTITEIWPLDPKTAEDDKVGGKYAVSDTMVFKKLSVAKGDSITVPVKAGSQIIGLYQPKRDEKTSGTELVYGGKDAATIKYDPFLDIDGDGTKETRAEIYGIADKIKELDPGKPADAKKIEKYFADANLATIFANKINVTKHGTVNAGNSSDFGEYYFKHKNGTRMREADGEEIYEVEVFEGKLEK